MINWMMPYSLKFVSYYPKKEKAIGFFRFVILRIRVVAVLLVKTTAVM